MEDVECYMASDSSDSTTFDFEDTTPLDKMWGSHGGVRSFGPIFTNNFKV